MGLWRINMCLWVSCRTSHFVNFDKYNNFKWIYLFQQWINCFLWIEKYLLTENKLINIFYPCIYEIYNTFLPSVSYCWASSLVQYFSNKFCYTLLTHQCRVAVGSTRPLPLLRCPWLLSMVNLKHNYGILSWFKLSMINW